jgi:hypothetical protein
MLDVESLRGIRLPIPYTSEQPGAAVMEWAW